MQSIGRLLEQRLTENTDDRSPVQVAVAHWLYCLVRCNVKRGRAFELDEVLATGRADCLGYAKLFSAIGNRFGLELAKIDELEPLIMLDEKDISEEKQDIYLWHKGFKTGVPASYEEIARRNRISPESVKEIIVEVENLCTG